MNEDSLPFAVYTGQDGAYHILVGHQNNHPLCPT